MDRRAAQIALFVKQIDEKNQVHEPEAQTEKKKFNMPQSITNMSEISEKLYKEDHLKREELITGKMTSLRDKINIEIQKKINRSNNANKIPSKQEIIEEDD